MNSVHKITVILVLALGFVVGGVSNAEAAPTLRSSAMSSAKTQKGARYVWGAEGGYSKGYDCSGLVYWAYKRHGKTLPRVAQDQYKKAPRKIRARDRKPGDLIFIADTRGRIYHVGIFTGVRNGKGYMLNANSGRYRGYKVVEAPVIEYTAGSPIEFYAAY
jgi:cell wall-associated NlpC family hydrolase